MLKVEKTNGGCNFSYSGTLDDLREIMQGVIRGYFEIEITDGDIDFAVNYMSFILASAVTVAGEQVGHDIELLTDEDLMKLISSMGKGKHEPKGEEADVDKLLREASEAIVKLLKAKEEAENDG